VIRTAVIDGRNRPVELESGGPDLIVFEGHYRGHLGGDCLLEGPRELRSVASLMRTAR
jgi:hypothetical protein